MIPVQQMKLKTSNGKHFSILLEKINDNHYECKFDLLEKSVNNDEYPNITTKGINAQQAFAYFINRFSKYLNESESKSIILQIDNTCNAELIAPEEQKYVLNNDVIITVNNKK